MACYFIEEIEYDHEGVNWIFDATVTISGPWEEVEIVLSTISAEHADDSRDVYDLTQDQAKAAGAPMDLLEEAAEEVARDLHDERQRREEERAERSSYYSDWDDYDDGYSSGPDYWVDRSSGEYRCG